MKEDKNKKGEAVDPELKEFMNEFYNEHSDLMKELEDDQAASDFAKKFIAEHKEAFDALKDRWSDTMAISEKELKSIQETNYLLGNKANRENLMESIHQVKKERALTPE